MKSIFRASDIKTSLITVSIKMLRMR